MAIKTTTNIDIDFYDKKYILVNAKQLDRGSKILDEGVDVDGKKYSRWVDGGSRYLSVTCYNHGELVTLDNRDHAAYIRYKKPDGHAIFNFCQIDDKGKIIVGFTEQMLVVEGICVADLVIVDKGKARVNVDTGEIINIDETAVLSTMPIHIDVTEIPINNSDIESTDVFNLLNTNLETYWTNFENVMKTSKSWAVGSTGTREGENTNNAKYHSETSYGSAKKAQSYAVGGTSTRDGENVDNAEYYSQMSKSYAMGNTGIAARDGENIDNAEYYSRLAKSYTMGDFDGSTGTRDDESTENAKVYMETAEGHMTTTDGYMKATEGYMNTSESYMKTSEEYMKTSEEYMNTTDSYMKATEGYMTTTDGYMDTTKSYMEITDGYMDNTESYMKSAETSETNALNSANKAQSYAVGGTGTRDGEDTNNAQWYYNEIKDILNGVNIVFVPKGTIYFSELATLKESAVPGYIYNIKDDFVTDDSFREGSGVTYTAGVNVYYIIDENGEYKWDCFGGASSPVADVEDVKDYLGI